MQAGKQASEFIIINMHARRY